VLVNLSITNNSSELTAEPKFLLRWWQCPPYQNLS